jgi:hypothetical protein
LKAEFPEEEFMMNPHESHYGEIDRNLCHKSHKPSLDLCSECHPPVVKKPVWSSMK